MLFDSKNKYFSHYNAKPIWRPGGGRGWSKGIWNIHLVVLCIGLKKHGAAEPSCVVLGPEYKMLFTYGRKESHIIPIRADPTPPVEILNVAIHEAAEASFSLQKYSAFASAICWELRDPAHTLATFSSGAELQLAKQKLAAQQSDC